MYDQFHWSLGTVFFAPIKTSTDHSNSLLRRLKLNPTLLISGQSTWIFTAQIYKNSNILNFMKIWSFLLESLILFGLYLGDIWPTGRALATTECGTRPSPVALRTDLSLAANMLGDFFAGGLKNSGGKDLIGMKRSRVIDVFLDLLDESKLSETDIAIKKIRKLLLTAKFFTRDEYRSNLFKTIELIKHYLKFRVDFLVPWGFSNYEEVGHAMLIEFEPSEDERNQSYNVTVYNTGSGIEFHEISKKSKYFKVQPFIEFKNIELMKIMDDYFLEALMSTLFLDYSYTTEDSKCHHIERNKKKVESDDLYSNVLQTLNGNRVFTEPLIVQRPQLSGTCAISSIWALMLKKLAIVSGQTVNYEKYKLVKEMLQIRYLRKIFSSMNSPDLTYDEILISRLILEHSLSNFSRHESKYSAYMYEYLDTRDMRRDAIESGKTLIKKLDLALTLRENSHQYRAGPFIHNQANETRSGIVFIPLPSPTMVGIDSAMHNSKSLKIIYDLMKNFNQQSKPYESITILSKLLPSVSREVNDKLSPIHITVVSAAVNMLPFENCDRYAADFPSIMCADSDLNELYRDTLDCIYDVIMFLVKDKKISLTASVILAISRLNYFAWHLACQWDERIFVPNLFAPTTVSYEENPDLYLKNYQFQVDSLTFVLQDRNSGISISDPSVLKDLNRLYELFRKTDDSWLICGNSDFQLFQEINYLKMAKNKCFQRYARAFNQQASISSVKKEVQEMATRSFESLSDYYSDQKKLKDAIYPGRDIFALTAPLVFTTCENSPLVSFWPPLVDKKISPYWNLRRLHFLSKFRSLEPKFGCEVCDLNNLSAEVDKRHGKIIITDFSSVNRSSKSIENDLCPLYSHHSQRPIRLNKYNSEITNKGIINFVEDEKMELDDSHFPPQDLHIGADIEWCVMMSRFDNGSFSLRNAADSAAVQNILFSPGYLNATLNPEYWPFSTIEYVFSVLKSLLSKEFIQFTLSVNKDSDFSTKHIETSSMAAYLIAQLLINIDQKSHCASLESSELVHLIDGKRYSQLIDEHLSLVNEMIRFIADQTKFEDMSIGILHASCLIMFNYKFDRHLIELDQFEVILDHYLGLKLHMGPENQNSPIYILEQSSQIYLTRLAQIRRDSENSDNQMLESLCKIASKTNMLKDYQNFNWKKEYETILLSNDTDDLHYDCICGDFWVKDWTLFRGLNPSKLSIRPELLNILGPRRQYAKFDKGRIIFPIDSNICIGMNITSQKPTLYHKIFGTFSFLLAQPLEKSAGFVKHWIYEPEASQENYLVWNNKKTMIILNSKNQCIYRVEKITDGPPHLSVTWMSPYCSDGDICFTRIKSETPEIYQSGYDIISDNFVSHNNMELDINKEKCRIASRYVSHVVQENSLNGLIVPPYRFDPDNAATMLIVLETSEDVMIELRGETKLVKRLKVIADGDYYVHLDQSLWIRDRHLSHNFIICEKEGKTYALVPIDNPRCFDPRNKNGGRQKTHPGLEPIIEKIFRLVFINIQENEALGPAGNLIKTRKLAPLGREQIIFCAYYFLGKQFYSDALFYLKSISLSSEFTDSEMKLLEMFAVMGDLTEDTFPEAIAIRVYAGYIMRASAMKFNSCAKKTMATEGTNNYNWILCRDPKDKDESLSRVSENFIKDLENYFAIQNNLTPTFIILSLTQDHKGLINYMETMQLLISIIPEDESRMPHASLFLADSTKIGHAQLITEPSVQESIFDHEMTQDSLEKVISAKVFKTGEHKCGVIPLASRQSYNLLRPKFTDELLYSMIKNDSPDAVALRNLLQYGQVLEDDRRFLWRLAIKIGCYDCEHIASSSQPSDDECMIRRANSIVSAWERYFEDPNPDSRPTFLIETNFWQRVFISLDQKFSRKPIIDKKKVIFKKNYLSSSDYIKSEDFRYIPASHTDDQIVYNPLIHFMHLIDELSEENEMLSQKIQLFVKEMRPSDYHSEISELHVSFREPYTAKYADFVRTIEGPGSDKLQRIRDLNSLTIKDEEKSRFISEIKLKQKKYQEKAQENFALIMKLWTDNWDPLSGGNFFPERRSDPSLGEMFTILAKRTKFSVRSIFIGLKSYDPTKSVLVVQEKSEYLDRVEPKVLETSSNIEDKIFQAILTLAFYHTGEQHFSRILKLLNQTEIDTFELHRQLNDCQRDERWIREPWIMTFEAAANIRCRKEQIEDIFRMYEKTETVNLSETPISDSESSFSAKETTATDQSSSMIVQSYRNIIVQRLMAYGKTLILGTCLALAKADGYHLSIIIPPTSLLEINANDMETRNYLFFNQTASFIKFNRVNDLEMETKHLSSIISTMKSAILERNFVIMSIETVQAIINRWIMVKRELSTWKDLDLNLDGLQTNMNLLEFILKILRERGAALFDEIDLTFDPLKDLSFPVGGKIKLDEQIKEMIIHAMYQISIDSEWKHKLDIASNKQHFQEYTKDTKDRIITNHLGSWFSNALNMDDISDLIRALKSEDKDHFSANIDVFEAKYIERHMTIDSEAAGAHEQRTTDYLSAKFDNIRQLISVAYLFVHTWLERDFQNNVGETMGPSLSTNYKLARPYAAAKTPKENSEFSDRFQTIILTCMMYANLGIPADQLQVWIEKTKSLKSFGDDIDFNFDGSFSFYDSREEGLIEMRNLDISVDQLKGWIGKIKHFDYFVGETDLGPDESFLTTHHYSSEELKEIRRNYQVKHRLVSGIQSILGDPTITFKDLTDMDHQKLEIISSEMKKEKSKPALDLIFDFVRLQVLQDYNVYEEQVFSTTLDASSCFLNVQGYSGTISNSYIFDDRIDTSCDIFYEEAVNEMAARALLDAFKRDESNVIDFGMVKVETSSTFDGEFSELSFKASKNSFVSENDQIFGVGNETAAESAKSSDSVDQEKVSSMICRSIHKEDYYPKFMCTEDKEDYDAQKSLDEFFQKLFSNSTIISNLAKYTSLIDIGAEFKEYENLEIAKAVLRNFDEKSRCKIKCVLFFDEKTNQLMFLRRAMKTARLMPATPNGVEDIDIATETTIEERFIIYGQRHITGVDIQQPTDCRAIVTLGKGNTMRDMLQGCFRLRKILYGQRVDFVISQKYSEIVHKVLVSLTGNMCNLSEGVKLEHLMMMALFYGYEKEMNENESVAFQNIDAAFKKYLINGKFSETPSQFDSVYGQNTFVRRCKDAFYSQVTASSEKVSMEDALDVYSQHLVAPLTGHHNKEGHELFIEKCQKIKEACPIKNSHLILKNCSYGSNETSIVVAEAQIEQAEEQEVVIQNTREYDLQISTPHPGSFWYISIENIIDLKEPYCHSLQKLLLLNEADASLISLFSENIYSTRNFSYITLLSGRPQNDIRSNYRRYPVIILMFPRDSFIKTVLMTLEETKLWKIEDLNRINGVFFSTNGRPILFKSLFSKQSPPYNKLPAYAECMNNANDIIKRYPDGRLHLAQILLLLWDFEVLGRSLDLKKILKDWIEDHKDQFVKHICDNRNYVPERKRQEFIGSEFYSLWKKLKDDYDSRIDL